MSKSALKDFSVDALPKTRKEQFFDIVKHRFDLLFTIGLFFLLFTIPFFAALTVKQVILYQAYISIGSKAEEYAAFVKTNTMIFDAIYIPCFIIMGLGFAGIFQIFKKLSWSEGIFFLSDFSKGFKSNWLRFLIISLLFGLFHICSDYFKSAYSNNILGYFPFAIGMLLFPSAFICLCMNTFYKNKFVKTIGDSIIIFLKRPVTGLAFILLPIAMSFIPYIGIPVVIFVIYLVTFLLIYPIYGLMFFLYSLSGFDRFSNSQYNKKVYLKGLAHDFIKEEEQVQ